MNPQAEWRQWLTPSEGRQLAKMEAEREGLAGQVHDLSVAMERIRNRCKMRKRASEGFYVERRARIRAGHKGKESGE